MPKVSILMNCYNGEKYLKEAIDSVYNQTFADWEIVFIDNCSTDNSASIAMSYGEKIKYYRTAKNIPLGAARNFGLEYCKSAYIAFLDTDDIWFDDTLKIMFNNIIEDDYAVVYGGHINISSNGDIVGKLIPSKKQGYILSDLLLQYDIPIVSSLIDLKKLKESNIFFIEHFTMFEDYALFLELSAQFKFKALSEPLLYYRIHDNSSSTKYLKNWATERKFTLNKIINDNAELQQQLSDEFKEAYARAEYYGALYLMSINNKAEAQRVLSKVKYTSKIYFLLWIISFFPKKIWDLIQFIKYKRNFQ